MTRALYLSVSFCLLALLCGCSPYVDDFYFAPQPQRADIPATQPNAPPPLSALASIVGVRRADQQQGIPDSIEVRLRIESTGEQTIAFTPQSLDLSDGAFVRFPPPILRPPQSWLLPPGQTALLTAYFPFPPGKSWDNTNLQSLQLRWTEQINGRPVRQVALFNRIYINYYYYGGYPYYYGYDGGVIFIHHHRR